MVGLVNIGDFAVAFHRRFQKQYKKLPLKIRTQFTTRLNGLRTNPEDPILHVHLLQGERFPLYSMNVTTDYRALFLVDKAASLVTFYEIGTHSELYG